MHTILLMCRGRQCRFSTCHEGPANDGENNNYRCCVRVMRWLRRTDCARAETNSPMFKFNWIDCNITGHYITKVEMSVTSFTGCSVTSLMQPNRAQTGDSPASCNAGPKWPTHLSPSPLISIDGMTHIGQSGIPCSLFPVEIIIFQLVLRVSTSRMYDCLTFYTNGFA